MNQTVSGPHIAPSLLTWPPETKRLMESLPPKGIFLTGIEGSDPMVGAVRRDQFQEAGDFYLTYKERLRRIRELGIAWVRVGPPYSKTHIGLEKYDLEWFDGVVAECQRLGISVMLDLLHFGLPDWMHGEQDEMRYFQNAEFPGHFAAYAKTLAARYSHIRWFTPVNEPFVTASFSSRFGIWNEAASDGGAYVRATANIARAAILAKQSIRQVWEAEKRPGEPIFLQNESFEEAVLGHGSGRQEEVRLFNCCYRFAALDLIFGKKDELMRDYLIDRGMSSADYEWFMENGDTRQTVLGIDHYASCVHEFHERGIVSRTPQHEYRLYEIARSYWERYPLPLLHSEVNAWPDDALGICQQTYDQLARLREEGYPVAGMAWYGDESQMDWHNLLKSFHEESPVGLFRGGEPQPVASLFSRLAVQGLP